MGVTFVDVKVTNPARPKKSTTRTFLVDSGAVYSVMPTKELKALGIKPTSSEEFILANGERIEKQVGNALFEFQGKVRAAPIIFGDEDVYQLGATTLEALGMILDPINRQLKPLPMVLMSMRSTNDGALVLCHGYNFGLGAMATALRGHAFPACPPKALGMPPEN